MTNNLTRIYSHSPLLLQNGFVSLYGIYRQWLRFGRGYKQSLKGYLGREVFTIDKWRKWQQEQLLCLLQGALKVPYYQRTWKPEEKKAALTGRLNDLPILEKAPIRENPRDFLRADIRARPKIVFSTSGSTGTPISTYWTVQEVRDSIALRQARSLKWAGVSYNMPRATISGRLVEPDPDSKGPFYRLNMAGYQIYFSAFHIASKTAFAYVKALRRHRIQWLTGYAVSYYLLAKYILDQKLEVPPLKAVITMSEKLTAPMKAVMEKAYKCRVCEEYSTVENALFAGECEHGRLHVSPDASVVEILKPDGTQCGDGEIGEVVTTCLTRRYQPFIRYRLGDLAMWDTGPCPCGRHMPVIKEVVGRVEDVITCPDGRRMVRFHGIFVDQPHVQEGQIIQEAIDVIRVKVVPCSGFGQNDIQDIVRRVQERLGQRVKVIVEPVECIPRNPSGKFKAVISKII